MKNKFIPILVALIGLLCMSSYTLAVRIYTMDYDNQIIVIEGKAGLLLVYESDGTTLFTGFNWTVKEGQEIIDRLWLKNNRSLSDIVITWRTEGLPTCYILKLYADGPHSSPGWAYEWSETNGTVGEYPTRTIKAQDWLAVDVEMLVQEWPIPCDWKLVFSVTAPT